MDNRGTDILDQFFHALPEGSRTAFLEEVFRSLGPPQQKQLLEALQQLAEPGSAVQTEDQAVAAAVPAADAGTSPTADAEEEADRPADQADDAPDEAVDAAWSAAISMAEPDKRQTKTTMRRQLWGCIGLLALGAVAVWGLSWLLGMVVEWVRGAF